MTDLNAKVEALRRYCPDWPPIGGDPCMKRDDDGEYLDREETLAIITALQARIAEVEGETVERCANAKRCKSPGACDARKLCGRFRSSTLISSEPASPSDP